MRQLIYLIFICLSATVFGQDIQSILENDPFDVARGKVDEETIVEEELAVTPVDLPVLDGTIIAGSMRVAMFSYVLEGKPASARVKVNEMVAQYTVSSIERHKVELTPSGGEPIQLALYSGTKDSRGGTKSLPVKKKTAKKVGNSKKKAANTKNDPSQLRPNEKGKNNNKAKNKGRKTNNRARPPRTPRPNNSNIKSKF